MLLANNHSDASVFVKVMYKILLVSLYFSRHSLDINSHRNHGTVMLIQLATAATV